MSSIPRKIIPIERRYIPQFEGAIKGYVINFMRTSYWRVEHTIDREELMQEAWVVFLVCQKKYYGTVSQPQHFMALFKTAWFNHFNDLSNANTKRRTCVYEHETAPAFNKDGEVDERQHEVVGALETDGVLAVMIDEAPKEVTMVLQLLLNAPQELLDMALNSSHTRGRYANGGSRQVSKLLGLPCDLDPLKMVRDYFA